MAPYYGLKTTNATWAAHCQGHCLNFLVDITYLWIMVLYWYLHASPVCKATGLETFGVRGHCMKLGRGTLWTHRNMLARQVSYEQYEQSVRTPLLLVHGTWLQTRACEARTLEQLVDGESESAVLLLHHDRNHCTCSWSHWHFNCTVVHYYIYLLLSEMLPTEWQTLSAVHCTVDKLKILSHLYKAMLRSWSLWYDIATKQNLEINIWIVSCNCQQKRCLDIQYLKSVKYLWST